MGAYLSAHSREIWVILPKGIINLRLASKCLRNPDPRFWRLIGYFSHYISLTRTSRNQTG